MKLHTITIAAILAASTATAGGMSQIIDETPPAVSSPDWSGPYAGLSYGRTTAETEITETFRIWCKAAIVAPVSKTHRPNPCPEPTTYTETRTETTETETGGVFAGYRWQSGGIVAGLEATTDGTTDTAEAHLGYAMGNVLPYAFAGAGRYDGADGEVYGAGIDVRLSGGLFAGIKATAGDFGDTTSETVALRVGWTF